MLSPDLCLRYSPRYSLHEDTVIERSIMPALKKSGLGYETSHF